MSLAIKWGYDNLDQISQGFIYFDATTSFKESLSGTVSSHPIDGGGNISDHFTRDNPRFSFTGVISGVDISYHARSVKDDIGNDPPDSTEAPPLVKINSKNNSLLKFIPDTVGQFFTPSKPQIDTLIQAPETLQKIRDDLRLFFKDPSPVQIFLYDTGNLRSIINSLIITSIDFDEDADSGDALWCVVNLEQVEFTDTKKTQIPQGIQSSLVSADLADKAAATENKGTQDSTEQTIDTLDASSIKKFTLKGKSAIDVISNPQQ
jgi:hypothetical protein